MQQPKIALPKSLIQSFKEIRVNEVKMNKMGRMIGSFFINLIKMIILIGISFIVVSPLIGILSNTFMSENDVYNPLVYLIPEEFTLGNLKIAIEQMSYVKSLIFTLVFCLGIMLIQACICALIGYGFARFNFRGNNILFAMVILTIVVPTQTLMVPMYTQFRYFDPFGLVKLITGKEGINLMNTFWPMLLMTITGSGLRSGLYIYIYRQFFKGLPKEIEEAAWIDGAGPFYTFFHVMLPNAKSSMITVMLFAFVWQYNDTYFASLYMSNFNLLSLKVTTLAANVSQALKIQDTNILQVIVDSGILLVIVPLLIIYLFLQRQFMEGIERSGIVG